MEHLDPYEGRDDHLRRLPAAYYRGRAFVHWTMTIQDRKTGWLGPFVHQQLREILVHTMFRYGLESPIYCCMPDHVHLLWVGVHPAADQLLASRFFRKHANRLLESQEACFQQQPYDHVLREEELERTAFENVVEYIARNPERKQLVGIDGFRGYPYSGCIVPGYPELSPWQHEYWLRFWRVDAYLRKHGLGPAEDE